MRRFNVDATLTVGVSFEVEVPDDLDDFNVIEYIEDNMDDIVPTVLAGDSTGQHLSMGGGVQNLRFHVADCWPEYDEAFEVG
jgi:hypothetical protein